MAKRVRVGLIGCGTIAGIMHLPGLRQMRELGKVDLVAVADTVGDKARDASEKYGVPTYCDSLDELLERNDFELLVNTTPIPEHFAVTLAGLRAGRHVYTQKPMATTVAEATQLVDEAARHGVKLAVAPEHPVLPIVQTIASLIADGAIGRVSFARVVSSHGGPEKHDVPRDSTWFYQPGSSPILDLGVHGLSRITAILGPVRRISCMSGRTLPVRMTTAGPFKGKCIDVAVDDNSLLLLDFGAARFGFLDATYCVDATLSPSLEIHGSEGTIAVVGSGLKQSLQLYQTARKEWREVDVPPAPDVKDQGVLHLVNCLLDDRPLILTGERGRHLVEIMALAPEAAHSGRTLELSTAF